MRGNLVRYILYLLAAVGACCILSVGLALLTDRKPSEKELTATYEHEVEVKLDAIVLLTATAITWTPTATFTPTHTFTPSKTPTITSTPTKTAIPTITPTSKPKTKAWFVSGAARVNIRTCPSTDCQIITSAAYQEEIKVITTESDWHKVLLSNGQTGYIAAWLTSQTRPSAPLPTQPPAAQPRPQQPPQPAPPPAPAFACDCSKTCPEMSSCEEAYFQLLQCGCSRRDGDGDGVPCEIICPGG